MALQTVANWRALDRNPEAVAIGSLFLALFAVNAWATLVAKAGYRPLSGVVGGDLVGVFVVPALLVHVVGFALGAVVYARVRNLEIPSGLPGRDRIRVVVSVVLAPVALVAVAGLVGHGLLDSTVSEMAQLRYSPEINPIYLVPSSFVPSLLRGVGYGLLFYAVVHERLRDVTTPRHALVLTPAVVGFFWEVHSEVQSGIFDPSAMVHFVVLVAVSVGFGASLGLIYRGAVRSPVEDLVRPAYVPVFVLGLLGVAGVVTGIADYPTGILDGARLAAFAAATYGYERTRSVWVPILVVAAFPAAVDVACYLEAVTGLAGPL